MVHAANTVYVEHSIEDTERRPFDALMLIILMIVTHLAVRWLYW